MPVFSRSFRRLPLTLAALPVVLALVLGGAGESAQAAEKKSTSAKRSGVAVSKSAQSGKLLTSAKTAKAAKSGKQKARAKKAAPPRPSLGQRTGLGATPDPLDLRSNVAWVIDQDTQEVLFSKNEQAVLPIASVTKLMTGLVVAEAGLNLQERIVITQEDANLGSSSRSRLAVGTSYTREELLNLALMSSENRAAHALGRTYPGGMNAFVARMNARATSLGMSHTRYVEPTGLSSDNRSNAQDLSKLVVMASTVPLLREFSTSPQREVEVGARTLQFNNTNQLVRNPEWHIGVQKTGYISEAGRCLVMQAQMAGRRLVMVFLDSVGKMSRIADAERVRRWLEAQNPGAAVLQSQSLSRPINASIDAVKKG